VITKKPITRKPNTEKHLAIISGSSIHAPTISEKNYTIDMVVALNWYGNQDSAKFRKYALDYAKTVERGECIPSLEKSSDIELYYIGVLGHMLLRNQYISDKHINLINESLNNLLVKYSKPKTNNTSIEKVVDKTNDKINELVTKYGAEIDAELDELVLNKNSTFSTKAFLEQNNINSTTAKKLGNLYIDLLNELNNIDNDSELAEGYNNFSKIELRRYRVFVQAIINECNQYAESTKVKRTVRVVKPKPASVVTANVQYLKEFPELNLKSVNVTKLVDSSEIWVYNTVTRKISVYYSVDTKMSVKGTTIINYDILKSTTKTIRKPEEAFKLLINLNKRTINNWFKDLTTKPIVVSTGRLNADNIILAIF